jgi:hypothetical protein
MYRWLSILPGSGSYPVQDPKIATFRMGKIQTILIALDLTVGFLVASTSLQAALTSTAVVSGSTTAVVAADPISYQGRLSDSGSPASGSYDFQFTLKDAASAGNTLGEAIKMTLSVQSGVFSASLPWSPGLFPGSARWIEVQVRPTPSSGSAVSESEAPYAVLERQRIQSTPYALRSLTSATVESVPVQSLPASVPLIGSEGKLDSGLLAADIARSSEVDSKVALLTKEDLGIKGSVKALEDANTARVAETASLTANLQNLQAKWTASQEAMDAKLAALTAENAALKKSVQVIGAPARSGWMVASLQAEDSELVSAGFSLVSSTPAASWVPTASVGAPSARSSSASVWTGQEWIIWGGSVASQTPVATGARYRPDTDTWSDLTSVDAPKARKGHTAVWTGSQMIVWGGFNENNLNTGGRFTPYPQSWSSMSTEDAPTARTGHRAVWTGKTMVIFGGRNSGGLLSDGGVYDPASDRWTALPTAGAPNARHLASVIWTGKALLVWGGELADGDANSGALLSFDSSGKPVAWSALPVLDALAGRSGHASVWDGQRFIVWGGRHRSGTVLADGALWDSTTSKWTYLDATGAPPARLDASAVWSGDELVVFGGSGNQGPLSSGAAWSLSTRKWRTLPSQVSTSARSGALSAWTGSQLLIFGGLSSGSIAMADPQRIDIRPPWYIYSRGALPAESLPTSSP